MVKADSVLARNDKRATLPLLAYVQTNQKAAPCCPIMYRIGSNVVKISRITTSDEVTPTVKLTFWEIFPPDSGDIYLAFI